MLTKNLPSIKATVNWIEKYHIYRKGKKLSDYCGMCGGTWPCASKRMAIEIRRLWRMLKPGDRPK